MGGTVARCARSNAGGWPTAPSPLLAAREVVDDVGHDLLTRWSEEHRRYHGLTHLSEVLAALDRLCATRAVSAENATVAALAA